MYLPVPPLSRVSDSKLLGAHCSVYFQVFVNSILQQYDFCPIKSGRAFPLNVCHWTA